MEMINQNKILQLLNDDFKCALVGIQQENLIVVKSAINAANLKRLIEFCEPLNYSVRFCGQVFKGIVITPKS